MRFNNSAGPTNPRQSMAAMIDVVFLLLIFFMLTLQIVEPEGAHVIESSNAGPGPGATPESEVRVRLIATDDGQLAEIRLGGRSLGAGDEAIRRLGREIQVLAREARGIADDGLLVKLDADAHLQFEYSLRAMGVSQKRRRENGTLEVLGTRVRMVAPVNDR